MTILETVIETRRDAVAFLTFLVDEGLEYDVESETADDCLAARDGQHAVATPYEITRIQERADEVMRLPIWNFFDSPCGVMVDLINARGV